MLCDGIVWVTKWWRRNPPQLRRLVLSFLAVVLFTLAFVGWLIRGPPPTALRLQRVLLPATLLDGGRHDYGAPTPHALPLVEHATLDLGIKVLTVTSSQ